MRLRQIQELFDSELKELKDVLLIDIGADLGLLGVRLLETKRINYVWNVELSKIALEESKKLYERKQLIDKASFCYSDGIKNLSLSEVGPREIVFVLAGLGSNTTLLILNQLNNDWLSKKLCLISLPHTWPLKLFEWAKKNNWNLMKEHYFKYREKIYPLLLFSNYLKNNGKMQNQTELFLEYWKKWYDKTSKLDDSKFVAEFRQFIGGCIESNQKNFS